MYALDERSPLHGYDAADSKRRARVWTLEARGLTLAAVVHDVATTRPKIYALHAVCHAVSTAQDGTPVEDPTQSGR